MISPRIDFAALEKSSRRIIQESDFSQRERSILHAIVDWSSERGREWARFEKLDDISKLTGLLASHVSTTISGLQRSGLLYVKRRRSASRLGEIPCLEIRFLPMGALAPAPSRIDSAEAAEVRAKLEKLNAIPQGFEPTGQGKLGLPASAEEQVQKELGDNSEAAAIAARGFDREPSETGNAPPQFGREHSKSGVRMEPEESRFSPLFAGMRSRAAAAGDHVPCSIPTGSHDHGHDHGSQFATRERDLGSSRLPDLTDDQLDLLRQLEELTEQEGNNGAYAAMWIMRIREHPIATFKAIAETRVMKKERRIRSTIGGTLNWNFKRFRDSVKIGARVGLLQ